MKKIVLLPQPIKTEAVGLLTRAGCEVIVSPNPKPETVLPLLKKAHAIILRTGINITPEILSMAPNLEIIARTGAGLDNVDVATATEKNVIVTSNLGVNTMSVVEHVLALMLSLSKKLPLMDTAVRHGDFKIRFLNLAQDISGKTLGLLGYGRIGSALGQICRSIFHMHVIVTDPYLENSQKSGIVEQVNFVELHDLFSMSDFLSIHVPLTNDTRNLVDATIINQMKPDAILINTARGGIIEEAALLNALKEKKIGGAGLDVFNEEPIPKDHPLSKLDNVILTPHTAALTKECVLRMANDAAQCVLDVFSGKTPRNVANPHILDNKKWKHLTTNSND